MNDKSKMGIFDRIDMEASTIAFKNNSPLYNKLSSLFGSLSGSAKNADLIAKDFSDIVMTELGLNVSFSILKSKEINAGMEVPQVTANHPLLRWMGKFVANNEAIRVARSATQLEGSIDFVNVKVSGVLSEIRVDGYVTEGAIEQLSMEELASIVCHELGHAWYNIAFLGINTACAGAMMAIAEDFARLRNGGTQEVKVKLIDGFSKNAEIKLQGNRIGNATPEEAVVFIRDAYQEKWRSTHGVDGFDAREAEFLADQFAVRMGAGYSLATALEKMWTNAGERNRFPIVTKVMVSIAWIIMFLFLSVGGLAIIYALISVNVILYNPTYDANQNRLERIWREMLLGLSKSKEPAHIQKGIIKQIEEIRKNSKQYEEEIGFWDTFWFKITKDNKRGSYIVDQQEQERMARNTLFLSAAKLNTV